MKRARALLATVPLLVLSACRVGPDDSRPEVASLAPDAWSDPQQEGVKVGVVEWWNQLGDEELAALINRALEDSLTLAESRERIVAARARRGITNADRYPTIDVEGAYTRSQTGDQGFVLGGAPPGSEVDVYSVGAVAGWELDLWGRVARLVDAADADIGFAIEDFRASRVALASEVAREVVEIRAIDRDTELVESTIETDQDALEIALARARAGFGNDLDAARARRDHESNLALLPGLRADRREAEFRLAVLLGVAPGAVSVDRSPMPRRDVVPDRGVPADLLMQRPDLRRAERDVARATARIGAAEADRFPRVSLSGSIALQGPDLGDVVTPAAYTLRLGPQISLPIFEGGRIRARVLEAESQQRQALIRLQTAVIDALAEVETASMRRMRAEERVERLTEAEAAARDAEALSTDRFAAGQADFLDVTEARRSRLAIERSRVAAERDALLRLVELYGALGGGWDPADGNPV